MLPPCSSPGKQPRPALTAGVTQEPANLLKTLSWDESHPPITIPGVPWPPLLPRERQRPLKARDGEAGWPGDPARRRAGLLGAPRQANSTTECEDSLRDRCQRRKMAPLAALLPPALIPELSTRFWHGDVSTDPPFTSARAAGEGTQQWRDPVTHPREMHPTRGSTRLYSSPRLHRHSPVPAAS